MIQNHSQKHQFDTLSFLAIPSQLRGKFLLEKALELGIEPGPDFKILTQGNDLHLDDGRVIKPEQVIEPTPPSQSVLLNYIPSSDYFDPKQYTDLVKAIKDKKQDGSELAKQASNTKLKLVYHSTNSAELFNNVDYLNFMNEFDKDTVHIVDWFEFNQNINPRTESIKLANKYKTVCPKLFPIQFPEKYDNKDRIPESIKDNLSNFNYVLAQNSMQYPLYPEERQIFSYRGILKHTKDLDDLKVTLDTMRNHVQNEIIPKSYYLNKFDYDKIVPEKKFKNEPEILFLGTCSTKPNIFKSSSAIYLNVKGDRLHSKSIYQI